MLAGPKVLGLVWSNPLSKVTRAIVPAVPGMATSRTRALVTTSSGNNAAKSTAAVVVSLMAQASFVADAT